MKKLDIDPTLVKESLVVARRELEDKYWWGDKAIKLIGPMGEDKAKTGASRKVTQWLDDIVELSQTDGGTALSLEDLPSVNSIVRHYRMGASALPPGERSGISINA